MGPKFSDPLYFESDGTLEVCGPANFGPNDISFELLEVTVVDKHGTRAQATGLPILVAAGEMWETEIARTENALAVGGAKGVGKGRVTKRNGNTKDIEWADHFELIDPNTFV